MIAPLHDGLMDRIENRMENRSVGGLNKTIVCNLEESDGSHAIFLFLSLHEMHYWKKRAEIVCDQCENKKLVEQT